MGMSTRFVVAVHTLALLTLEEKSLSSAHIAGSVNTNPVVIRRILGPLQEAGLITTQLGADGGASLAKTATEITLLEVFRLTESGELFALHHTPPNPLCLCGHYIQPVLQPIFDQAQAAMEAVLAGVTIADIAAGILAHQTTFFETG